MRLQYFSTEILTKIFEYCTITELNNLQQTCRRFYEIIKVATTLGNNHPILVTNQLHKAIQRRCWRLLTLKEKYAKLLNWENGLYREYNVLKENKRFMPKLILTKDSLWISKGNKILGYKRNKIGIFLSHAKISKIQAPLKSDISTFVLKDQCFISGLQDGSLFIKKLHEDIKCFKGAHDDDIHSVDLSNNTIVSGSKNGCLKIWNLDTYQFVYSWHDIKDRIWSVALSKAAKFIGVGTAQTNYGAPLYIYDVNSLKRIHALGKNGTRGAGLLQLKWETPYELLSCGYDGTVSRWDLRTNLCVQSWEDPFFLPVHCFDTDGYCTLLSGTSTHGRVVLWDMRMKSYVQCLLPNRKGAPRNFKNVDLPPLYESSLPVNDKKKKKHGRTFSIYQPPIHQQYFKELNVDRNIEDLGPLEEEQE